MAKINELYLYPEWMKLKNKRISVGTKEGEILHDLASQLHVQWDDGTEGYVFKSDKHKIL